MSGHLTSNLNVMPCVLGGVAVGASLAFLALTQSALKKFDVSGSQTPSQKAAPAPTVGDPNSSGLFDDMQGYVKVRNDKEKNNEVDRLEPIAPSNLSLTSTLARGSLLTRPRASPCATPVSTPSWRSGSPGPTSPLTPTPVTMPPS